MIIPEMAQAEKLGKYASGIVKDRSDYKGSTLPRIEMNIACQGWPAQQDLQQLAERSVAAAIKAAKIKLSPEAELSLMFGDDEAIKALNQQFRGINKPTNVLSFPGEEISPGEEPGLVPGLVLGDIAFALQTLIREADLEGKLFDHHLCHLMIHGFLHLLGYDHQNDNEAEQMESLEIKALAALGIADPYASLEPGVDRVSADKSAQDDV